MDLFDEKDHYSTLGVDSSESASGIHDAYRRLAKQYHPDYAGDGSRAKFQDIQQAYEVLSDPEKRKQYDRRIGPKYGQQPDCVDILQDRPSSGRQSYRYSVTPEPLIPAQHAEPLVGHTEPDEFHDIAPLISQSEALRIALWALWRLNSLGRF